MFEHLLHATHYNLLGVPRKLSNALETYSPKYSISFLTHVRYANPASLNPPASVLGLLTTRQCI